MNRNLTEMVFILDRSGSMSGLESDTIGGFNSLLSKQQKEQGDALVTTVLFDNQYELLHNRLPVRNVQPMNDTQYFVRGTTALLDAIGRTIRSTAAAQNRDGMENRPAHTIVAIITDGMENASCDFSLEAVKAMIELQKANGWEFLFLGANIDAVETAGHMGIEADRAVNYRADAVGTELNYEAISETVSCVRACRSIPDDWKQRIDEDYMNRE